MEWLADRKPPESLLDPGTPDWLFHLDRGPVCAAMRRVCEAGNRFYLIDIELNGGTRGGPRVQLDDDGVLRNTQATTEPAEAAAARVANLEIEPHLHRTIDPQSALDDLREGRSKFDALLHDEPTRSGCWPANRALLDFVIDHFTAYAGASEHAPV